MLEKNRFVATCKQIEKILILVMLKNAINHLWERKTQNQ